MRRFARHYPASCQAVNPVRAASVSAAKVRSVSKVGSQYNQHLEAYRSTLVAGRAIVPNCGDGRLGPVQALKKKTNEILPNFIVHHRQQAGSAHNLLVVERTES